MIFFIFHSVLQVCLSAKEISIVSNPPGANVFISGTGKKKIKIGRTPFKKNLEELTQKYVKGSSFLFELSKEGYDKYRLLFTKTSNVNVEVTVNLEIEEKVNLVKNYDKLINNLFDIQRQIRSKNYDEAIQRLIDLEKANTYFSVIPELKGYAYYLKKEIEKSCAFGNMT
jgi:hypothetical protein